MKFLHWKIFITTIFILNSFFISSDVLAVSAGDTSNLAPVENTAKLLPEKNLICWTKEWCKSEIEYNKWTFTENSFEPGGPDNICGKDLGVCLPAGETAVQITIGENKKFSNIGDYIRKVYNYLLWIGGTVALVVLIMGGFFWLSSAGSPERINSAKSYIGGSLAGLILLLGSYTLLYTINPDLVHLRLPRTYMIRRVVIGTKWCKDLGKVTVAFAGGYKSSIQAPPEAFKMWANPLLDDVSKVKGWIDSGLLPACSLKYFWVGSNDQTCWGHVCAPLDDGTPQVCLEEKNEKFTCKPGNLSGTITGSNKFPFIDNNINLMGICNSGDNFLAKSEEAMGSSGSQSYIFKLGTSDKIKSQIEIRCQNDGGIRGYFFGAEINDKPGCDDWVAIGQNNGKCNVNLSKILFPAKTDGNKYLGCNQVGYKKNSLNLSPSNLISSEQIKSGFVCDIDIGTEFPAISNHGKYNLTPICAKPDPTECNVTR